MPLPSLQEDKVPGPAARILGVALVVAFAIAWAAVLCVFGGA